MEIKKIWNETSKEKWILLFLLGLLAAVVLFPMEHTKEETKEEQVVLAEGKMEVRSSGKYEEYLSVQLKTILENMDGVGKVDVWITLSGSEEQVVLEEFCKEEKNLMEEDSVGGNRQEVTLQEDKKMVVGKDGNPYVIKTMYPEVEGVFILAEGAGESRIKKEITEAAEVLFGIDAHRIKVAKKKVEE